MTNETKTLIIVGLVSVAILVGGAWLYQSSPTQDEILSSNREALVREDSIKQVAPNEKVVVVEFGDYQCPACAYIETGLTELKETYKDNVTFVFRNLPLSIHKNAMKAAEMTFIANEQGKYWEMHAKLYTSQKEWESLDNPTEKFVSYAQEIGMNTEGVAEKLSSGAYTDRVRADMRDAELLGINSTPTFFIGDTIVRSADYGAIKKAIDDQLAK